MLDATSNGQADARIMLSLLSSVERNGSQSQRRLASELGISLGLANAYMRRCVSKGLVKYQQIPTRRYIYYLTRQGFAEKSALVVRYLSNSFEFLREAKRDCTSLLERARTNGNTRVVLMGNSDLTDVAAICALELNMQIQAVVDAGDSRCLWAPLVATLDGLAVEPDVIMVTDLRLPNEAFAAAVTRYGRGRVLVPSLLHVDVDAIK